MDSKRTRPNPFPGRHPVRWRLTLLDKHYAIVKDITTRPHANWLLIVNKWLKRQDGYLMLAEFDRGGAFKICSRRLPLNEPTCTAVCQAIHRIYYPFGVCQGDFFYNWRFMAIKPKLIKMIAGKRVHQWHAYDALDWSEANFDNWREYRTWLKKINPWK